MTRHTGSVWPTVQMPRLYLGCGSGLGVGPAVGWWPVLGLCMGCLQCARDAILCGGWSNLVRRVLVHHFHAQNRGVRKGTSEAVPEAFRLAVGGGCPSDRGGGCCRLQMPLRLAFGVRETVAGHRLDALEGGGGYLTPFQCTPAPGWTSPLGVPGQSPPPPLVIATPLSKLQRA